MKRRRIAEHVAAVADRAHDHALGRRELRAERRAEAEAEAAADADAEQAAGLLEPEVIGRDAELGRRRCRSSGSAARKHAPTYA